MFQPWLAHAYPGMTVEQLERGYWSLGGYVALADYVRRED